MSIAVYLPNPERRAWWVDHLGGLLPDHEVLDYEAVTRPGDVHYAVAWKPPTGWVAGFPNVKACISIGAGIDHIAADTDYPADVPVLKTKGTDLTQRMCEYVMLHVLRHHRELPRLEKASREGRWDQVMTPTAQNRRVGVMGLGELGRSAVTALIAMGFDVAGWSRSGAQVVGMTSYAGSDALPDFLARTEILVCLLPLTPETEGILNRKNLSQMPQGAKIINCARGPHLVDADLLALLDSGHLAGVTLDVFHQEPLPTDNALWGRNDILITPHIASLVDPVSGGKVIASNICKFENGEDVPDATFVSKGY
ncbi:glyoxylate/hydroxypyruvate reductase A [Ahrensia sp. R2A130]|uniref:2-hydroxyacid dehydrogenase n=1 Tax=Ahrensia sp. R2A130 TaxID=744979 RepID=UPI0001E094BF|nr:glyoxylate/hydroxypyruvate reductase A [Ahrensia sp. R2A130]EFL88166.1 glyoxylate/hydroxypyruvate reductase A [Ahrensia sp. R2A130]